MSGGVLTELDKLDVTVNHMGNLHNSASLMLTEGTGLGKAYAAIQMMSFQGHTCLSQQDNAKPHFSTLQQELKLWS